MRHAAIMVAWLPVVIGFAGTLSHPGVAGAAMCSAQSGELTNPLVELYASGRCTRCAVAERWLAGLGRGLRGAVTLLWQTDEAGYLPGKPRDFRGPRLTLRQRLALEDRPIVLLQTNESGDWATDAFLRRLADIAGRPARMRITLRAMPADHDINVEAGVEFLDDRVREVLLYVAAYAAREGTEGSRLAHAWQGPWPLSPAATRRTARLPPVPGKRPDQSGVAAFVRDRRTGEGLQALTLPPCPP